MEFSVQAWAPEYGAPVDATLADADTPVDLHAESPPAEWAPRAPGPETTVPDAIGFVDGVRRVEARIWFRDRAGREQQGICASFAAGLVVCDGRATIERAEVRRIVIAPGDGLDPIATVHGRFGVLVCGPGPEAATLALQGAMADLEDAVSRQAPESMMVVVDGPLRDRRRLPHAVGYVKTHHVNYLPDVVADTVPALGAGQRTPLFVLGGPFPRWSWYLRLPTSERGGWAGVVRCELGADRSVDDAVATADAVTAALPGFASVAHKDPRAPQNLFPIAGLERELRRRLGDGRLLVRALRAAADRAEDAIDPR